MSCDNLTMILNEDYFLFIFQFINLGLQLVSILSGLDSEIFSTISKLKTNETKS